MAGFRFWSGKIIPVYHLYIHFPFCSSKCSYCAFYSVPFTEELYSKYRSALAEELAFYANRYDLSTIKTLYIGGGTPAIIPGFFPWFDKLARSLSVGISDCLEYTIECNPLNITSGWISEVKKSGCNRISIGIQSFTPRALELAGRALQSEESVYNALSLLEKAGFSLSIDLINGLPGSDPSYDINQLAKLLDTFSSIKHLSCYDLYIEPQSAFGKENISPLDENAAAGYEQKLLTLLKGKGFSRYEVANFCKDQAWSLHNRAYWLYKDYLGLGPAAHSSIRGERIENSRSLDEYASETGDYKNSYSLSRLEQVEEYLLMGFRLTEGIDTADFSERFGLNLEDLCPGVIKMYTEQKMMTCKISGGKKMFAVTPEGMDILNTILAAIFCELDKKL